MNAMDLTTFAPFGALATLPVGTLLDGTLTAAVRDAVREHRILVLRGIADFSDNEMISFCATLGQVLEWEFGAVNELRASGDAKNYLYTTRAVPFHWDGAFAGRVPYYIFFHCKTAPPAGNGGETTFSDTVQLLHASTPERCERWKRISITYSTEKIAHYGGSFSAPLVGTHPITGEGVLRFAEPVEDLNPVRLRIDGLRTSDHESFLEEMHALLNDSKFCYAHEWKTGDVVIADNHALLHGRRAFHQPTDRHLRRVNVL